MNSSLSQLPGGDCSSFLWRRRNDGNDHFNADTLCDCLLSLPQELLLVAAMHQCLNLIELLNPTSWTLFDLEGEMLAQMCVGASPNVCESGRQTAEQDPGIPLTASA